MKPVPEIDTDVADVSPVPFTTIVCWLVVLAVQVPKSTVLPFVGDVMPEVVVVPPEMVALRFTLVETEPLVMVSVPVYVPPEVPLKFTCSVPPLVEFIVLALSEVVFTEKPVPLMLTVAASVKLEPFTFTDCWLVVFAVQVPKSTVLPFVGLLNVGVVVVVPATVAFRFTLIVVLPFVRVNVPEYEPPEVPLKLTCSCAPDVEFTLDALRLVELQEKPVPETATVVDEVSPVPFTTIVC